MLGAGEKEPLPFEDRLQVLIFNFKLLYVFYTTKEMEGLVFKETVVLLKWGIETQESGIDLTS